MICPDPPERGICLHCSRAVVAWGDPVNDRYIHVQTRTAPCRRADWGGTHAYPVRPAPAKRAE